MIKSRKISQDPSEPVATRPLAINIIGDGTYFPTVDLTKNVCELVDSSGNLAATYDYAPFGKVTATGTIANPLQWSSEIYDSELGLVYYNYRHYSPTDGRFLSRDPIEEQGGLNPYAFVGNMPMINIDSFGGYIIKVNQLLQSYEEEEDYEKVEYDPRRIDTVSNLPTVLCCTAAVATVSDCPLLIGNFIRICCLCVAAIAKLAEGCYVENIDKNRGRCNPCERKLPAEQHHRIPNQHGCRFEYWHTFRWNQIPYPICKCIRQRIFGGC